MAQGIVKVKKSTTAAGSGRGCGKSTAAAAGRQKKGARVIKPKKRDLVKGREIVKKYSAGLTAMTERTLGAKAGHLELLKGGKKNKDAKEGKDSKGKPVEVRKGGSRKFG